MRTYSHPVATILQYLLHRSFGIHGVDSRHGLEANGIITAHREHVPDLNLNGLSAAVFR
jgi:hypothetical protein